MEYSIRGLALLIAISFTTTVNSQQEIELTIDSKHDLAYHHSLGEHGLLLIMSPTAASGDPKDGSWVFTRMDNDFNVLWETTYKMKVPYDDGVAELDRFSVLSSPNGDNVYLTKSGVDRYEVVMFNNQGEVSEFDLLEMLSIKRVEDESLHVGDDGLVFVGRDNLEWSKFYILRVDFDFNENGQQIVELPTANSIVTANTSGLRWTYLGIAQGHLIMCKTKEKRKELITTIAKIDPNGTFETFEITSDFSGQSDVLIKLIGNRVWHVQYYTEEFWTISYDLDGNEIFFFEHEDDRMSEATKKHHSPDARMIVLADGNYAFSVRHQKDPIGYSLIIDSSTGEILKSGKATIPVGLSGMCNHGYYLAAQIIYGDEYLYDYCTSLVDDGIDEVLVYGHVDSTSPYLITREKGSSTLRLNRY